MNRFQSVKKYLQFTIVVIVFAGLVAMRQMLGYNTPAMQGPIAQIGTNTPAPSQTNSLQINPPIRARGGEDSDLRESFRRIATTQPTTAPATPTPTPAPATTQPTTAPVARGQYKDGTYTGAVADAFYGNVQIQVAVANGKISAVTFLQYPNDNGTSQYVNSQAMPMLQAEALQAQSANVNVVSGASATSGAFLQSLASALAQAKA
jgi:uncharacterized protein with FMN-binding domain